MPAAPENRRPDRGRVALCAVADDDHLQDVVATGRALQRSVGWWPLFVHVATPAVRLRVPVGFAAGPGSAGEGALPLDSTVDDLAEHARDAGVELLQRAGIAETESVVVVGDPVAEINRLVCEHEAALVVVGSHRRGGLASAVSGSVSQELSRRGACPVLIARSSALPSGGGPIVCGIDAADERTIEPAVRAGKLALSMNRSLILVHVAVAERRALGAAPVRAPSLLKPTARQQAHARRVLDAVSGLPRESIETVAVEGTSIAVALDQFAAERRADLLVVGCRGSGVVRRTLEGSVSLDLLRNGRRPLVIVPPV